MSDFTPRDQAARDTIAQELDRGFLVEAGAGTGKTTVLVDRIVQILRTGHAGIDEIAVITFTEKAAAELEGRIRDRLDAALRTCADPAERERIEAAIAGLGRARIETIHAFAASLLRERPVEAGLDPGFAVLDELGQELAFDEAYRAWLAGQLQGRPPALWRALNRGLTLAQIREVAEAVHAFRDVLPLAPLERSRIDVAGFVDRLETDLAELDELLPDCRDPADNGARRIAELRRLLADYRAVRHDPDSLERRILATPKISGAGNKANWHPSESGQRQKEICRELGEELADLQAALRADAVAGLLPLVEAFVRDYAEQRRRAGTAEFDDLLIWARDLLRDDRQARRYFQRRFRCLLIDEFQDTDPLQVEIVLYLTSPDDADDWRALRPAPGALFVVGDPKQSIYRFRRADITIYEQVKREIFDGDQLHITQNFRSLQRVISWVNRAFNQIIEPVDGVQAAYVSLEAGPSTLDLPHAPVVVLCGDGSAKKADEVRQQEAAALAHVIREAVAGPEPWLVRDPEDREAPPRPARWRDVAILLPTRSGLAFYEEALAAAGIPYRHEGGRHYFQRQEVRDLLACLRAIDDPTDQVALVAALRSGAFGCSDEEIFLAATAGGLDYRQVPPAGHAAVSEALAALRALHDLRRVLPLPELIRRVLDATHLVAFALTLPQGDQAAANLLKMVDQARAFAAARGGGLRAFVRWVATTAASRNDEADAAVAEASDDVVRILTIHAAKGLEFPIVALANLNSEGQDRTRAIPDREGHRLHLRVGSKETGFATPGFEEAREQERLHAEAERDRLLYVAATRARDHLIIPRIPEPANAKGMLARLVACLPEPRPDALGRDVDGCHLRDCALLPILGGAGRPAPPVPDPDEVEAALAERAAWLAARADLLATAGRGPRTTTASSVESWDEPAPTGDARDVAVREPRDVAIAIGVALHDTMQRIDLAGGHDVDAIAREQAGAAGVPEHAGQVADLARRCLASPGIARALRARRHAREVVYTLALPGGGLVEGRMDLLFQEEDGLVILDYKTDRVTEAEVDARLAVYRNQAAVYAFAAGRITGLPVKEVIFLFAHPGLERALPADSALLTLGETLAHQGGSHGGAP